MMVLARSEHAHRLLEDAFAERTVARPITLSFRVTRPEHRNHRRSHRQASPAPTTRWRWSRAGARASRAIARCRRTGSRRCSRWNWRPAAPTRSACTWPRRHPCVGDLTYGADPVLAERLGRPPVAARRPTGVHPSRHPWSWSIVSSYPEDLAGRPRPHRGRLDHLLLISGDLNRRRSDPLQEC